MKDLAARIVITAKDRASGAVDGLRKQFGGLRGAVVKLGGAITTYLSARTVIDFFTGSVRAAADLEEQLDTVGAVMRANAADMDRLKAAAEEMGATTRYTATEAAQAMEALGRAGLNATETIAALPDVLALAQGNGLELAQAAEIVTKAAAGMGVALQESGRIADVFTAAAARANTNVEDLAEAFSYAAPSARAAGLSVEELAAYIGKLADAGIDGSRAGTALNNMLSQFGNESSAFAAALREAGIYTDDFNEALRQLEAAGTRGQAAINAIGQEAGPALRALLAQGTGSVADLTAQLRGAGGEAARVAAEMDSNLKGAIRGLGSAWESLQTYIGQPLLEKVETAARDLSQTIRDLVTSGALEELRTKIVDGFTRGYAAIKSFVIGLTEGETSTARLKDAMTKLVGWFERLGQAASVVGNTIVAVFKTVDSAVSGVATGVVGAITVVQAGVNKLVQGMNAIGLASDRAALKSQALNDTLVETTKQLGERSVQSARDAAAAVDTAAVSLEALAKGGDKASAATARSADATEAATQAHADHAAELDQSTAAQESLAGATERATTATREQIQAQQEVKGEADEAAQAAQRLEDAFATLGVTSSASLQETAAKAREAYQVISASDAPVRDVQRAFESYAQAAVHANDGVISATLRAEAAQAGLRLAVSEAGQVSVMTAAQAQQAWLETGGAGENAGRRIKQAMEEAAAATAGAGDDADEAAGKYGKLAEEAERAAKAAAEAESEAESEPERKPLVARVDYRSMTTEQLRKALSEQETYQYNPTEGIIGSDMRDYYQAQAREAARVIRRELERREIEDARHREALARARGETDEPAQPRSTYDRMQSRRDDERRSASQSVSAPTKVVRLQIGSASIDAPEDQAARFVRELERYGMRAN